MANETSPRYEPYPGLIDRPLTASMPNQLAWRMGEICRKAMEYPLSGGDPIDRGLILRRLLEEGGFEVRYKGVPE